MEIKNLLDLYFLLNKKKISSLELSKYILKYIEEKNKLNLFIDVDYKNVFLQAKKADELILKKKNNLLTGIPIILKDNIINKINFTTSGSKFLKNFKSPCNSTIVNKLNNFGSILLGKSNMNEFGVGSDTNNFYFGRSKNYFNKILTTGGSSGGCASSISCNLAPLAIASDTGGSIRQPASFNNVVGFKPTYGRLSRYGLISYSSSLDTLGFISNNVLDCSILFTALNGFNFKDLTTFSFKKENFFKYFNKSWLLNNGYKIFFGLTVGISKNYFFNIIDYDIRSSLEYFLTILEFLGVKIIYLCFYLLENLIGIYNIISSSEIYSNLSKYDAIKYGYKVNKFNRYLNYSKISRTFFFSEKLKIKLLLGNFFLSDNLNKKYFFQSKKLRRFLLDDFQRKFKFCDFIINPISPILPWINSTNKIINDLFLSDFNTIVENLSGLPCITIPIGFVYKYKIKIPISVQIVGNYFSESRIFQFSNEIEKKIFFKN